MVWQVRSLVSTAMHLILVFLPSHLSLALFPPSSFLNSSPLPKALSLSLLSGNPNYDSNTYFLELVNYTNQPVLYRSCLFLFQSECVSSFNFSTNYCVPIMYSTLCQVLKECTLEKSMMLALRRPGFSLGFAVHHLLLGTLLKFPNPCL